MSEKTREVPQLADATYANTLVVAVSCGYDTCFADNQSMSIGCIGKLGYLSGFRRHNHWITWISDRSYKTVNVRAGIPKFNNAKAVIIFYGRRALLWSRIRSDEKKIAVSPFFYFFFQCDEMTSLGPSVFFYQNNRSICRDLSSVEYNASCLSNKTLGDYNINAIMQIIQYLPRLYS